MSKFIAGFALSVSITLTAAGGQTAISDTKENSMSDITPEFKAVLSASKLVCFGRFVVEIPATAEVVFGPSDVPYPLTRLVGKGEKIEEVIAARLSEIENERYRAKGELRAKDSMLGKVIKGGAATQKIVFGIRPGAGDYYRIESHVVIGDDIFVYKANPSGAREDYEVALQKLNAVSLLLRSRSIAEIPSTAGLCVDGGFVEDSSWLSHENITLGVRLAEFPDVHVSIATTKKDYFVESDALEIRLKQAEDDAIKSGAATWYSRIKFIRKGLRSIDKWLGFEVLTRKPGQGNENESHEFAFLSQGQPKNAYLPVLDIKLHSGVADNKMGQRKPSITDEEAMLLWDKLTGSIRVRPTK